MGKDIFHHTRLLKVPSNLVLNISRDRASTITLVNLFLSLTTLMVKHFFLKRDLNLPSFSLKLLPFGYSFLDQKCAFF